MSTYNIASGPLSLILEHVDIVVKHSLSQTCVAFNNVINYNIFKVASIQIAKLARRNISLIDIPLSSITHNKAKFDSVIQDIFKFPVEIVKEFFNRHNVPNSTIYYMAAELGLDHLYEIPTGDDYSTIRQLSIRDCPSTLLDFIKSRNITLNNDHDICLYSFEMRKIVYENYDDEKRIIMIKKRLPAELENRKVLQMTHKVIIKNLYENNVVDVSGLENVVANFRECSERIHQIESAKEVSVHMFMSKCVENNCKYYRDPHIGRIIYENLHKYVKNPKPNVWFK